MLIIKFALDKDITVQTAWRYRMPKRILTVALIIVMGFGMAACKQPKKRYQAQFLELFDTVTTIIGYSPDEETFSDNVQMIYDYLQDYHRLYDIYTDYEGINNIKTINDNAGIAPVVVDQRIIDLLKFAKDAYQFSGGRVNVAFGAVLAVWHEYRQEGIEDPEMAKLPPMELLQEKAKHTDINKLIIDEEASTVYLDDPEMRLDVGAIAKGYATERLARMLEEKKVSGILLSVGGNVRAIGAREEVQREWNVGIQNPDRESDEQYLLITRFMDKSLVSSGDYERYYTVDGKEYHHIIDPKTLMPAEYFTAVSILCKDSGMADALSTAIFTMPLEEGRQLIESLDDTEALWVQKNGELVYSSVFESYIKK